MSLPEECGGCFGEMVDLESARYCENCRRVYIDYEGQTGRIDLPPATNDFDEYQELSKQTAKEHADPDANSRADHKHTALFLAVALNGEAGELGEKVKKYVREDDDEYLEEAEAELGDVLWYLAQMASLLDKDLSGVADENLEKLLDREERGQITGSGDNR